MLWMWMHPNCVSCLLSPRGDKKAICNKFVQTVSRPRRACEHLILSCGNHIYGTSCLLQIYFSRKFEFPDFWCVCISCQCPDHECLTHCVAECCDLPALACRACSCLWISRWQGKSTTHLHHTRGCMHTRSGASGYFPWWENTASTLKLQVKLTLTCVNKNPFHRFGWPTLRQTSHPPSTAPSPASSHWHPSKNTWIWT